MDISTFTIGDNVFYGCSGITLIIKNITTIGPTDFSKYYYIFKKLIIEDNVEIIENNSFKDWNNLENIEIGSFVKMIGDYAFYL